MITRAYIEEQVDQFHYRVRIPIFDKAEESPQHTSFDELAIATVCVPKGLNNSLNIGDVVIVGFEDNSASRPIILGQLYRDALLRDPQLYINTTNISISDQAFLPYATNIGDIAFSELFNATQQVPILVKEIEELRNRIQKVESTQSI